MSENYALTHLSTSDQTSLYPPSVNELGHVRQHQPADANWNQLSLLLCAIDKVTNTSHGSGVDDYTSTTSFLNRQPSTASSNSSAASIPQLTDDQGSITSSSPATARLPQVDAAVSSSKEHSQDEMFTTTCGPSHRRRVSVSSTRQLPYPAPIPSFSQLGQNHLTSSPHDSLSIPEHLPSGSGNGDPQFYLCTFASCNRSFTRYYNLKSHMRTHTNDRPYTCEMCSAGFSRMHDLKRHANVHSGKRTFQCPHCDKSFSRLDAVNRHKNTACKRLNANQDDDTIAAEPAESQ